MLSTPGRPFDNSCARCPSCPRLHLPMTRPNVFRMPRSWLSIRTRISTSWCRTISSALRSCEVMLLTCTALNQPTRTISASPRASPRSDLLGRTDNTAWACRASRQTTGRPSAFKAWVSQTEVGPLSRPTRARSGARFLITLTMAAGSDATLPSKHARSVLIQDADAGFLQRHIQPDKRSHGHSPFVRDRGQFYQPRGEPPRLGIRYQE